MTIRWKREYINICVQYVLLLHHIMGFLIRDRPYENWILYAILILIYHSQQTFLLLKRLEEIKYVAYSSQRDRTYEKWILFTIFILLYDSQQTFLSLKRLEELPREPHRSTLLLKLTDRSQYDAIMWLALRSVKSNNAHFLNHIRYFSIKYLPNFPHETRWTPFQA